MFIPLIVVNCMVLGRAEGFASKNGVLASAVDGLCQGIGYTVALVVVCVVREFLGSGTFGGGLLNGGEGIRILPEGVPAMQMVMPVGGFLALGCVIAGFQYMMRKMENKKMPKCSGKIVFRIVYAVVAVLILGTGMCLCLVWQKFVWGTLVGLLGIVMLIALIPMIKGIK